MQAYLSTNKYSLLNIKVKYDFLLYLSIILLLTIILLSYYIKTYDSYKYSGYVKDNKIILNIESNNINNIIKSDYLKLGDKKLEFSILSVGELQYDESAFINYNQLVISVSGNYYNNAGIEVTFYNNKQRIITKILNLFK